MRFERRSTIAEGWPDHQKEQRPMRRLSAVLAFWILLGGSTFAQGLDLADLKAKMTDPTIPIEERVRRVLQGASTLDQAAQHAGSLADRRSKWASAVSLLDEFIAANPLIEAAPLLQFQAGVYRWAEGQGYAEQFEQKPADESNRAGAIKALDDAIRRFRAIKVKPDEFREVFGQNLRYRLAQAIADRSGLDPEEDPARISAEREAMALLDESISTPGLKSFAILLKGQLGNRLGLYGQAQMEIQQAEKLVPPPSPESLIEAKVIALVGRRQFPEATQAIGEAKVAEPLKNALKLKILIAQRRQMTPGRERRDLDDQAFTVAERLRGSSRPEGRRGLMELARNIDEPGPSSPPEWWDLLAEGHLRLGNPTRAGRLDAKGADRADLAGAPDQAASLRYKAGAYLFEAGKFSEADQRLTRVIDSPTASKDLKARAGMLRSLARGRALATQETGASRDAYIASLEAQVRDFPSEASTGEARWLLGQIRLSAGKPDDAVTLWSKIVPSHPRWLEAQVLSADLRREAVEIQRINRDSAAINALMEIARKSLQAAIAQAKDGTEQASLKLQLARLELIPETGKAALALDAADRVLKGAATSEQHRTARLYRMVALAEANRGLEAEKVAQTEAKDENLAGLLPTLRLLDRAASESESDVTRRRIGLISGVMTNRIIDHLDQIPANLQDEARLHHVRALLLAGDQVASKKELTSWGGFTGSPDDEMLRELADTYVRLDAFALSIDVERFRASRLSPGTLPWFESRYGLALAYYRAERPKDARQIIDATAILHPELGGGELRAKFERLRQKLAAE
jgi:TolA-binding protein